MKQVLILIVVTATMLSFLGCDDAKQFVKDSKDGYKEVEEFAHKISQISSAIKTNDYAQAKEIAAKIEPFLNSRVISWTVQVLAIEEKEGVEAARAAIEKFKTSDNITPSERTALDKMATHYQNQTGRTGDLLVLIAAFAGESKFGHGGGQLVIVLCDEIRTTWSTNRMINITNLSSNVTNR